MFLIPFSKFLVRWEWLVPLSGEVGVIGYVIWGLVGVTGGLCEGHVKVIRDWKLEGFLGLVRFLEIHSDLGLGNVIGLEAWLGFVWRFRTRV